MNKAGLQLGADKSQILCYKTVVQAEMNVMLLFQGHSWVHVIPFY